MTKKLFIKTHGCQMNEYDSAKMFDLLEEKESFELAENEEEADLLILNTCSIREKAQEKVFHQIGRWRKIKDKNPDLKIAIGGCVASQEGENIIKRAPAVDIVFGPQTLHKLPELYENKNKTNINQVDISFPKLEKFNHIPVHGTGEPSAFVSIIEGCNKYCSFCVVPKTRGHEVSRTIEDILNEISALAENGTREIHLLGQNVNNFKGTYKGEKSSLAKLIELTAKISHVHLPVQSGSDRILKLTRRRYNVEKYLNLVEKIRKVRPDMSFSSDFIVGFPGETNDDFMGTMNVINEVRFDESFSFIYSPRPNTTASDMEDDVTQEEKKERLNILQERLNQLSFGFSRKKVGTLQNCLVYGQSKRDPGQLQGRTICNRVVNFPSNDIDLVGQMINIQINEALPNCLRGNLQN